MHEECKRWWGNYVKEFTAQGREKGEEIGQKALLTESGRWVVKRLHSLNILKLLSDKQDNKRVKKQAVRCSYRF